MNVKEYLSQIYKIEVLINNKQYEIERIRQDAEGVRSMDYTTDRVQTSRSGGTMAEWVNKIIDAEDDAVALKIVLTETRKTIINQINGLDKILHIQILFKRYVEHKTLKEIAKEIGYEYEYVRHAHGYALEEFRKKYFKKAI